MVPNTSETSPPAAGAALLPLMPLLVSMASLCIGTSYAKSLFPVAGAAGMTALRLGLSATFLALAMRPWRWRLTPVEWRAVIAYGVVLACMNMSFYMALRTLPLGIAIAVEFLGPLGLAAFYTRRPRDAAWVALAAVGVAVLVLPRDAAPVPVVGILFALAAALFWAGYIVVGRAATVLLPPHRILCLGLCIAAVVAVPIGVAEAGSTLLRPDVLAIGAVVALLSSLVPYFLELIALRQLTAFVFGIVVSLEPAVGAVAGAAILGERLAALQWAGILAVVAASFGSTLTRPRAAPDPAPAVPV